MPKRLKNLSFDAYPGQCWHVLGANGSGKSSLLYALAGLHESHGAIYWHGKSLLNRRAELSHQRCLLPQHHELFFDLKVTQAFDMLHGCDTPSQDLVDELALEAFLHTPLRQLSGGERQRVYIALYLMQVWPSIFEGRALVLLDEPCQQLDPYFQSQVLKLIGRIQSQGNLVIQSHHDVNQSLQYASHVLMLKKGEGIKIGEANALINKDNLHTLYNQAFIEISEESENKRYLLIK